MESLLWEVFKNTKIRNDIHGIPEKSVHDSKQRSLLQLKKIVELCARNVSRETDQSSAKLQKKSHLMLGE